MARYKKGQKVRIIVYPWEGARERLVPNPKGLYDWRVQLSTGAIIGFNEYEMDRDCWWKCWRKHATSA